MTRAFITAASIVLSTCLLAACQRDAEPAAPPATGDYVVQPWTLFAEPGSMAPDLSLAPDGRLLLSWLNHQQGRRNALQFATYTETGGWQSQPRTIAVGHALIANWADTPHILATADGALWAQWLQANAAGPSAYDIVLARSRDGGMTWTQLTRVNGENHGGYSGFAALWQAATDRIGIAWLDGGGKTGGHDADDHEGGGDMRLLANSFDRDLQRGTNAVVDPRVCDCCQTDVALTTRGPLLVYRDRSDGDIRDIATTRLQDGAWTAPKPVHADNWKIEGCPVNGPAIAARENSAVVAWYSEGGGEAAVRLARSTDAGDAFAAPVVVDKGATVLGRVDVALDAQQAWVSWLREDGNGQTLMLARYAPDLSRELQRIEVARLQGRGRATGSPKLATDAGGAWLAWTDAIDGAARLQGARIAR